MKELKTKRLRLSPMSDAELAQRAAGEGDPELRGAYEEMLAGCRAHPDARLWYTAWRISLRDSGDPVGDIGFKGPPGERCEVEVGYGIDGPHRGRGYATEAARALTQWALAQQDVYFVMAETAPDNGASRRVLEKLGFKPAGEGAEGPRFELERSPVSWMAIYMCLGLSVGLSLGTANGQGPAGMSIGLMLGLVVGAALDTGEREKRAALAEKRKGGAV